MAKGRKLTISRSERFLGEYTNGQVPNRNDSLELREEDVWSIFDSPANGEEFGNRRFTAENYGTISVRARRRTPDGGGVSVAFHGHENVTTTQPARHVAASAPVNVPDWSKILRADSVESLPETDDGADDGDSEMVPPHEYLARAYARSRNAAATSVFEGVGRTLKGRDMRRVRDAVWSQTGFDG